MSEKLGGKGNGCIEVDFPGFRKDGDSSVRHCVDTVRIDVNIREGERERIQVFEGHRDCS